MKNPLSRHHIASGQTLIISTLILGFLTSSFILISLSTLNQNAQNNTVLESKAYAAAAATGCMEQAINRLGLYTTSSYTGNQTLSAASTTCTIRPITSTTSTWTVDTYAQVNNQYARYRVILTSLTPVTIGSWREIDAF